MAPKNDIEIAQQTEIKDIRTIAASLGLEEHDLALYGRYKAKIVKPMPDGPIHVAGAQGSASALRSSNAQESASATHATNSPHKGKLILVTATNPTPAGEGKTTTTIGLTDALRKLGKKAMAALREPSLGPVFGVKGGATGGGYAQVIPMEDINLHFTGDFHAIGAANNLLAAMIDNHLFRGNQLQLDPRRITWRRAVDMNDRQLRNIVSGLGGKANGFTREDGFDITVASEIMAIFCLAENLQDLKKRLAAITVGYTYQGTPVTAGELKAEGALTALLQEAFAPNLVQTLEGTPVCIHGGPFANIAHGCNSVVATKTALHYSDITVTEAGFGADLGAEKFFNIKARATGLYPNAVVLVTTIRSLKYNGGVHKEELNTPNAKAVTAGLPNLMQHIENITHHFDTPVVVAINEFPTDTAEELAIVQEACAKISVKMAISRVWAQGGAGGVELAEAVLETLKNNAEGNTPHAASHTVAPNDTSQPCQRVYKDTDSLTQKIEAVATKIYRANGVTYTAAARKTLKELESLGYGNLPICMAKTQYSFSDNAKLLGAPRNFTVKVSQVTLSSGAGFVVVQMGSIMKMPGLPKVPSAEHIDVTVEGKITGLF